MRSNGHTRRPAIHNPCTPAPPSIRVRALSHPSRTGRCTGDSQDPVCKHDPPCALMLLTLVAIVRQAGGTNGHVLRIARHDRFRNKPQVSTRRFAHDARRVSLSNLHLPLPVWTSRQPFVDSRPHLLSTPALPPTRQSLVVSNRRGAYPPWPNSQRASAQWTRLSWKQ